MVHELLKLRLTNSGNIVNDVIEKNLKSNDYNIFRFKLNIFSRPRLKANEENI